MINWINANSNVHVCIKTRLDDIERNEKT